MKSLAAQVWGDASYLPHAIDADGRISFVHADIELAQKLPFLDGRARFWNAEGPSLAPDELLSLAAEAPPRRMLLHMAFGGSTMAARLLDVPGETMAWREPAIEIALADRHAAQRGIETLRAASDALLSRHVAGAIAFTKPSNWANVLVPQWATAGARMALITMAPRDYLVAVFRGGRDRIAYVLRSSAHFARMVDDGPSLLAQAQATAPHASGSLLPAAQLTLAALALQYRLFAAAAGSAKVDAAEFRSKPVEAALHLSEGLGLPVTRAQVVDRLAALSGKHAKADLAYDPHEEQRIEAEVERHHGVVFDQALLWAERIGLTFDIPDAAMRSPAA